MSNNINYRLVSKHSSYEKITLESVPMIGDVIELSGLDGENATWEKSYKILNVSDAILTAERFYPIIGTIN